MWTVRFLLAVMLTFSITGFALPGAEKKDVLTVSVIRGNIISAIFYAILEEVCRDAGIGLERVSYPQERSLLHTKAGMLDGDGPRNPAVEKKYPELIRVPENFFDVEFVGCGSQEFVRQHRPVLNKWQDLKPWNVSWTRGWKIFDQNVIAASATKLKSPGLLVPFLRAGRTDIILVTRLVGLESIAKNNARDRIVRIPGVLARKPQYLYLSPARRDLAPKLAAALARLKQSGRVRDIRRQHVAALDLVRPAGVH